MLSNLFITFLVYKLFNVTEYYFAFAYCLISGLEPGIMLCNFYFLFMQAQGELALSLQRYTVRVLASNFRHNSLNAAANASKLKEK